MENRFREALTGRLRDINAVVLRSVEEHETELLRLLDRSSYETASYASWCARAPSSTPCSFLIRRAIANILLRMVHSTDE